MRNCLSLCWMQKKKQNDQHNLWIFSSIVAILFETERLVLMETEISLFLCVFPSSVSFPKKKSRWIQFMKMGICWKVSGASNQAMRKVFKYMPFVCLVWLNACKCSNIKIIWTIRCSNRRKSNLNNFHHLTAYTIFNIVDNMAIKDKKGKHKNFTYKNIIAITIKNLNRVQNVWKFHPAIFPHRNKITERKLLAE